MAHVISELHIIIREVGTQTSSLNLVSPDPGRDALVEFDRNFVNGFTTSSSVNSVSTNPRVLSQLSVFLTSVTGSAERDRQRNWCRFRPINLQRN